jgi:hypothetical protein
MSSQRSVVFAEPVRTAIGAFGGAFKDIPAPDLGAAAIKAAVARAGLRPDEIETVVMGNVVQAGVKMNPARQAATHAGLPVATPALTVNRVSAPAPRRSSRPRRKSCWGISRWPRPVAWRTWISRPIWSRAADEATGWAMASSMTASCGMG